MSALEKISVSDVCRAVLESKSDDLVVLTIPGTSYRLHFKPGARITKEPGKRIIGTISGKALRIHAAAAGGKFIEPIYGHPRIVQGTVVAIDTTANRLLIDMVVPVWLVVPNGQTTNEFSVGQMVNMYVESGMTFTPS